MKIKKLGKRRSRYTFRKAGPSGRGKGRTRYHVDFAATFKFLGTIEGCHGSWTLDEGRTDEVTVYRTRELAAAALRAQACFEEVATLHEELARQPTG